MVTPTMNSEAPVLQTVRTTCLYCEQRGETVFLVPFAHWGICPKCDPVRAAATTDPLLREKGIPNWPHRG